MSNESDEWKVSTAKFQGYMKASVDNMNGRFDKIDDRFGKIEEVNQGQNERIGLLEKFNSKIIGVVTAVGALWTVAVIFIQKMWKL